jgi:hypothetical protein
MDLAWRMKREAARKRMPLADTLKKIAVISDNFELAPATCVVRAPGIDEAMAYTHSRRFAVMIRSSLSV